MIALLERLLPLWTEPVDGRGDPEAAFGEVYADPVVVNGTEMSLDALVARARSLQQAFDQLGMDILGTAEAPRRVVVPVGVLGGRAARRPAWWVGAAALGLPRQLDAARLNGLRGTRQRRGP